MVIDELFAKKGTQLLPIDSYDNQVIDEIEYEGQKFHFANQKDLTGTTEIVADNAVEEPIRELSIEGNTEQQGTPTPTEPQEIVNASNLSVELSVNKLTYEDATIIDNFNIGSTKMETFNGSKCACFEIQGGKKYKIYLSKSTRFSACTTYEFPQINTPIYNRADAGAITPSLTPRVLTVNADANSKYLVVRFYNQNTDVYTEQNILNTLYVDVNAYLITTTVSIPSEITLVNGTVVPLAFNKVYFADTLKIDTLAKKVIYTKNNGEYIFTGDEYISRITNYEYNGHLMMVVRALNAKRTSDGSVDVFCNYWKGVTANRCVGYSKEITCCTNTNQVWFRVPYDLIGATKENTSEEIIELFRVFVKEKYNNGTPIKAICTCTPIEYDLTDTDLGKELLALEMQKGTDIFTITSDNVPVSKTDLSYWRQIIPNE